jgi:hypothetical protein
MPLTEPNQTIVHEDLSDAMTVTDVADKPFTTMVGKGPKPENTIFFDPVDKQQDARLGGVPDGSSVNRSTTANPAANRGKVGGRIQVFERDLGVGFIAMSVSNAAGVTDEYLNGVTNKLSECKGDMELTFLSDQESRDSAGSTSADLTRGVGKWVESAAPVDTTAQIPSAYRTPSNQIVTVNGATAFNKAQLDNILMRSHTASGGKQVRLNAFMTPSLLQRCQSFFEKFEPSSTELPLARYTQDGDAGTIKHAVTRYINAFGQVDMLPSQYMGGVRSYTGSSGLAASTTNTSTTVTLSSAFTDFKSNPGLQVGMRVYGTGIPAGAYITAVNSSTEFVISAAATATGTPTLYFGELMHGHFLDMKYFQLRSTLNPGHTELPVDGSGKHGFIRAIAGLQCTNPTVHARVTTRAAAES